MLAHSQYESLFSSTVLVSQISHMCRFARNVRTVCVCGGITSLGFSVDWTSSSLSRVDLSGLSWHRSCPGHLWEAAVVWAPAYSAVYLCLCLAIKRRVLQHRVIFFTPWKHSRVPGYPLARVTTSTNVDDTTSVTVPGYTTISIIATVLNAQSGGNAACVKRRGRNLNFSRLGCKLPESCSRIFQCG